MKRHNPFSGFFILLLTLSWSLGGALAFAQPVPMRTAWLGEHETFIVWYAKEKGWDKEAGLDLMLMPFASGKAVIDEMRTSDWAVAGVGAMPALTASLSNKLYIIGIGNDESASNMLFARKDSPILAVAGYNAEYPAVLGSPDTVRGKTILCPKGTSAHYVLSRWLHILGLTEKDVVIRDMKPDDALKAFAAGGGDVLALWAPQTYEAEQQGLKAVAHSTDCKARQPILIVANMEYANKHMDQIVAFLSVYMRGIEMMKTAPHEQLVADYMRFYNAWTGKHLTPEAASRDIADHPVYPLKQQLAMFKMHKKTSELREWLNGIVSFHIENGEVARRDISRLERLDYVTDVYLKKVNK